MGGRFVEQPKVQPDRRARTVRFAPRTREAKEGEVTPEITESRRGSNFGSEINDHADHEDPADPETTSVAPVVPVT